MANQASDIRSRRRSRSMTAADSVADRQGRWFKCFLPPKAASFGDAVKGRFLIVFGAGTPNFNGVYHAIGLPAQLQPKASFALAPLTYRKMHGPEVIMHYRGWWLFAQKDRPDSYYGVRASTSHFPPEFGWQLKHGQGPAPHLQVLDSVDEIPQPLRERGLDACRLEVHGSGTADFNGVYDVCGVRGGKLRYCKRDGLQAIIWYSGWWLMNEEGRGETSYGLQAKDSGPMPPTGAVWSQKSGHAPVPTLTFVSSTPRSRARTPPRLLAPVAEVEESDQRANTQALTSDPRGLLTTHEAQEPDDFDDLPGSPEAASSPKPTAQEFPAPIEALLNHCAEALLDSGKQSQVQITTDILSKAGKSTPDVCSTDDASSEGSTALVSELLPDTDALKCQSSMESEEQAETGSIEVECADPCEPIPCGAQGHVSGPLPSAPTAGPKPREPAPWTLAAAFPHTLDAPLPDVDAGTATGVDNVFSRSVSHKLELESIPDNIMMPGVVERRGLFSRARTLQDPLHFLPLAGLEPEAGADEVPAAGFVSLRVAELNSLSNSLR